VKLKIAWVGRTKSDAIQSLTEEYLKRLKRYAEVQSAELRDESAVLELAGDRGRSKSRHVLVLLDSRGRQLTSEELAKFLQDHEERNPLPLAFAVGGADGFSEATRGRAALVLSLGKMTLAHELARVVLLEQLYRACTIRAGHPYHLGH
jgi:23S rRNA (pseudouridine1915-N3)-methyltransferase